jgi:2-succinyl-5-enolpyruvyl-6-hydroxy-3-cyclohexene-1-carboxylate synthase
MPNRNTLHAEILIDELVRAGVQHVCLSPGSRNTPLVMAAAKHASLHVTSHLDERSAAFFALGVAIASERPVVLVCTSGSAAANYFPAIVEAHQSRVPLIVLSADRPHEVRYSGANQTIDQVKMFGSYALWSVDLPLPEAQPTALAIRNLRSTANRAVAIARGDGEGGRKGVVHLNVPFRPPLEPTDVPTDAAIAPADAQPRDDREPFARIHSTKSLLSSDTISNLQSLISALPRGLIVCGPKSPNGDFASKVNALSRATGYPLLSDAVSGVRFGVDGVMGGYDTFLAGKHGLPSPDLVIRFGGVPTSKWLNQYLDEAKPRHVIQVSEDGVWADDAHRTTAFVQTDAVGFVDALMRAIQPRVNEWRTAFDQAEATTWRVTDEVMNTGPFFDGIVVCDVVDALPDDATLFVGNSLPVRHLDQFGRPGVKRVFSHANRGASGIDGNISTALGLGYVRSGKPIVGIVGDVTLYHDMNGLLAAQRCGVSITLVLLNNNGGGIFHRLPVKDFEPEFTQHFITPHGLDFAHAARLYGFDYVCVYGRDAFRQAFATSVASNRPNMIEVRTDATADLAARAVLMKQVQTALVSVTPAKSGAQST